MDGQVKRAKVRLVKSGRFSVVVLIIVVRKFIKLSNNAKSYLERSRSRTERQVRSRGRQPILSP